MSAKSSSKHHKLHTTILYIISIYLRNNGEQTESVKSGAPYSAV